MRVQVLKDIPACIHDKDCGYELTIDKKKELCNRCIFQPKIDVPKLIKDKIKERERLNGK